jgi:hypothetical protein
MRREILCASKNYRDARYALSRAAISFHLGIAICLGLKKECLCDESGTK